MQRQCLVNGLSSSAAALNLYFSIFEFVPMTNRTYKQLQISNHKDFLSPKDTSKDQLKLNKYIITHRLKIGD